MKKFLTVILIPVVLTVTLAGCKLIGVTEQNIEVEENNITSNTVITPPSTPSPDSPHNPSENENTELDISDDTESEPTNIPASDSEVGEQTENQESESIIPMSFKNFIGEWDGISNLYLAQHMDIAVKIISVDEYNQTITLSYKYTMESSGVWDGGEVDYRSPITIKYSQQDVKVQNSEGKFDNRIGYVTDMITVTGSNQDVSSILPDEQKKLCAFKLAIVDNTSLYNMSSPTGWTYYDEYKCSRLY